MGISLPQSVQGSGIRNVGICQRDRKDRVPMAHRCIPIHEGLSFPVNGWRDRMPCFKSFPPSEQGVFNPKKIEDFSHGVVDQLADCPGSVVEGGDRRKNNGPHLGDAQHET